MRVISAGFGLVGSRRDGVVSFDNQFCSARRCFVEQMNAITRRLLNRSARLQSAQSPSNKSRCTLLSALTASPWLVGRRRTPRIDCLPSSLLQLTACSAPSSIGRRNPLLFLVSLPRIQNAAGMYPCALVVDRWK